MKTFLKRFGFLAILAIMFNVEVVGQEDVTVYFKTKGTTEWYSDYRNSQIMGVAGDTIELKCKMGESDFAVKWEIFNYEGDSIESLSPGVVTNFEAILLDIPGGRLEIKCFDEFNNELSFTNITIPLLFTKFAPSELSITSFGKNDIDSFPANSELTTSSFNINYAPNFTLFLTSKIIELEWYCNDILKYSVDLSEMNTDVIESETLSSEYTLDTGYYYIKIKVVYTNTYGGGYGEYEDFIISDSVKIYNGVTQLLTSKNNCNNEIVTYPNPTTEILYISEEVEYSVYSYSGQKILKGFGKQIDVKKLSVGTYILKTNKGDSKFTVVR